MGTSKQMDFLENTRRKMSSTHCIPIRFFLYRVVSLINIETDRTIKRDLAHLQKIGILNHEQGRKEGHWIIVNKHNEYSCVAR